MDVYMNVKWGVESRVEVDLLQRTETWYSWVTNYISCHCMENTMDVGLKKNLFSVARALPLAFK